MINLNSGGSGYTCLLDTQEAVKIIMRQGDEFNHQNYPEHFHNLLGDCACRSCRIGRKVQDGQKYMKGGVNTSKTA